MAEISVRLPKPKYGQIVVLQKNGDEPRGHGFPLTSTTCVVGRCLKSDIRITSADVSDTHCKFLIDEVSGEASLEIHGNETEVNGTHFEAVSLIKLNHKDVVLVGGRKLRFEYLPPDYKPLSNKPVAESTDSFSAEVVDLEENGDVVDSNAEREEDIVPEVPCTPSLKRVSFGPYLSPEQFDNTLPPATPIKKGATPRRSTRYSGLKFTRAPIDPLIEEEGSLEMPADEKLVTSEKECVDETLISEDAEASVSSVTSVDETSLLDKTSPSLAEATEFPEISARANLDMSSIDAMSTMSDVSNIAVVPSECCSFLDEPIEEGDFEVVEQEDTSLFDDDLIGAEIPVPEITTPHLTNGTNLLRSFTTSSLAENLGEEEEEGITLSPEDMSEGINGHSSTVELAAQLEDAEKESVLVESTIIPSSPQADDTDVRGVKQLLQTPNPATPKADYTDVEGVKQLLKTPKNAVTSPQSPMVSYSDVEGVKDLQKTPKPVAPDVDDDLPKDVVPALEPVAQVEAVCGVSVEKLIETPESSPSRKNLEIVNSPPADSSVLESKGELSKTLGVQAPETPKVDDFVPEDVDRLLQTPKTLSDDSKLNCTDLEGVARLLETPKTTRSVVVAAAAVGKTPEADYTDVRGIKKLLQTPKPPPNTPKADYRDVRGVKRLLATPKATPGTPKADYTDVEGVDLLMKTPKAKDHMKESDEKEVPEKLLDESTPEASIKIANSPDDIVDTKVDEGQPLTSEKEEIPFKEDEVETKVTESRRGHRVSRTPKTKTPNIPLKRTASPSEPEELKDESSVEEKKSCPSDELAEVPTGDVSEESTKIPSEIEQQVEEEEPVAASAPKRGRRAATSKTNTPKADYRDVSGLKRLLKTPKATPGTPKADYSDVEGVDLLMKTPKAKDPVPQIEQEEKNVAVVEEEVPEKVVVETASEVDLQSSEATEEPVGNVVESVEEIDATASQMDLVHSAVEEEPVEKETNPPKRARRAAAAKVDTPKADYRNVSGVKRLLRTPRAIPGTPKADYSDVEGVDILMKTPKPKDPVPQNEEEEKDVAIVEEEVPEKLVVESTPEAQTSEPIEESVSDVVESVEVNTLVASQMDEEKPFVEEEIKEEEPEAPLPKRGRRAAAAKADTPKADYRNVSGVKRLLKTPKAMPGTPKADYSDVEGVDLLMKTPNPKDPIPQIEVEEKNVAVIEKEVPEKMVVESTPEAQTSVQIEEPVSDVVECVEVNTLVSSQMDEEKPVVEEEVKEEEPEAPLPKRGRRAAAAKTNTPKLDCRDVREVEKLMKTSVAAPGTPKVDCTDVEGVELLTNTPKTKGVESENEVAEESSKKSVEKTTTEAAPADKTETTDEHANGKEQAKESEVEKDVIPARRSRRAVPTPKTNTPKPAGRSKRKQPQSEPEIQPEVNETVEAPVLPTTEKEEPAVVEEALSEETNQKAEEVPVKSVSTPKRGRRAAAAPASKVETPKATRSTRVKKQTELDSGQAEAESRPVRSRRRKDDLLNDEKLSLSPVVRLCHIEVPQVSTSSHEMAKEENKRVSSSSNDEVAPAAVKPVGRGRGRAQEIKKTVPRRGKAAEAPVPDVVEPVPSADEMEEVEAKPAKKTRRATSKQAVEKVEGAPEVKRRRGGSKPAAGLDDVEMLHEGKGHAADIHAHHMPDDLLQEMNEESPATTSSGRPTRGRKALKVHFDVAGAAASPVRSTRSTRKTSAPASSPPDKTVSVLLERDPDIDTLAAVAAANEDEEKGPTSTATKRPRQKKVPAVAAVVAEETEGKESPAAPAVKRTRGGKKVSTDSDVPKVDNSSPPPAAPSPRRTRRTRNI